MSPPCRTRCWAWYARHGRDLPWRRTRDPYAILVAEVMLQQTQVDRIAPRWKAWLEQFPTLRDLAAASRADVIRAWQGLGYNLRAVRLHEIARQVTDEGGGALPRTLDGLLALRGIGRYTAGAVACFAYEQPVSMVDTNVRRVLGRVFAPSLAVDEVADVVLPPHAAYAWNQALMDLGATLCRADRPLCLVCPLLNLCRARASGRFDAHTTSISTTEVSRLDTLFSGSHRGSRARAAARKLDASGGRKRRSRRRYPAPRAVWWRAWPPTG